MTGMGNVIAFVVAGILGLSGYVIAAVGSTDDGPIGQRKVITGSTMILASFMLCIFGAILTSLEIW